MLVVLSRNYPLLVAVSRNYRLLVAVAVARRTGNKTPGQWENMGTIGTPTNEVII